MPVFAFGKQGFDPDLSLAQRFVVGFSRLVASHPIQHLLIHTAAETAALFAGGTLGFEWAMIAVFGASALPQRTLGGMGSIKAQFFTGWTEIDIPFRLIAEAVGAEELRAVIHIGTGDIGMDALVFDGDQIFF